MASKKYQRLATYGYLTILVLEVGILINLPFLIPNFPNYLPASTSNYQDTNVIQLAIEPDDGVMRIFNYTNQERIKAGLPPLEFNTRLTKAAKNKLNDMYKKDYFAHQGPNGQHPWDWIEQTDYSYTYAGENLAIDFDSTKDTVKAWMTSENHRQNILNEHYDEMGVAISQGYFNNRKTVIYVQMFGSQESKIAQPQSQYSSKYENSNTDDRVKGAIAQKILEAPKYLRMLTDQLR